MKRLFFIAAFILFTQAVRSQNHDPGQKDQKDGPSTDKSIPGYFILDKDTIYANNSPLENYKQFDTAPDFPGGFDKFNEVLNKNLQYPPYALKNNISGKVYVSMIIKKDGTIINIKGIRGPSQGLIDEATRLVGISPKWNPAMLRNNPVNRVYIISMNFSVYPHPEITASAIQK